MDHNNIKQEAENIIKDTIDMIDEYEDKINLINEANKRSENILKALFIGLIVIIVLGTLFYL